MPVSILLSSFVSYNVNPYGPTLFWLLGSRDGINWTLVYKYSGSAFATQTFTVNATQSYNYYRFVVGTLLTGYGTTNMYELIFNGTEESLCITSDSKVGVGIANPQRSLEVAGDLVVSGTISGGAGMGSFRNRIINGDMRIAQRGTSFTLTSVSGTYTLDRYPIWLTGTAVVAQQTLVAADTPYQIGFKNSLRVTASTSITAYLDLEQSIEGYNTADLNWGTSFGSPVTVSFWFRSQCTSGSIGSIAVRNSGANYSYTYAFPVVAPATWQYVSFTVPPPPNGTTWLYTTGAGIILSFCSYLTTNQCTAGSWQSGNFIMATGATALLATPGNFIEFTGIQLEKGTVATPFEVRPYATELQLCQRYYYQITAPASGSGGAVHFASGYVRGAGSASAFMSLPVPMRTQPTFSNTAPMQFDWNGVANLGQFTGVTLNASKTNNYYVHLDGSVTGGTQGQAGSIEFASSAAPAVATGQYVAFNAEL